MGEQIKSLDYTGRVLKSANFHIQDGPLGSSLQIDVNALQSPK